MNSIYEATKTHLAEIIHEVDSGKMKTIVQEDGIKDILPGDFGDRLEKSVAGVVEEIVTKFSANASPVTRELLRYLVKRAACEYVFDLATQKIQA